MNNLLYGIPFLSVGLGLLVFNKTVAKQNKAINELFGGGTASIRFYRVVTYIAGGLLCAIGVLLIASVVIVKD